MGSRMGNDSAVGACTDCWTGTVGWLRIMVFFPDSYGWQVQVSLGVERSTTPDTALGTSDRRTRLHKADQAHITRSG